MGKEQKSTKEKRKPKADKKAAAPKTSGFSAASLTPKSTGSKKSG